MKQIQNLLNGNNRVSEYKINIHQKESCELFFVKGKLETVRFTDTCDKEVTVYANHGNFKGEAQFFVYPSTTEQQLHQLIEDAVEKALLIQNQTYELPEGETGTYAIETNFVQDSPAQLAERIAEIVFDANTVEHATLNSVEIFINKHTETVVNSRGLHKTQVRYDAMVEAIPTYNGDRESVELYEQYNFGSLDENALRCEIAEKMAQAKARYEAVTPDFKMDCPVVINELELSGLFRNIVYDLNYASVYSHSNLFSKGDAVQKEITGDPIGITMTGTVPGSVRSSAFDSDGLSLGEIRLVQEGRVENYFGSNRYGQYLGQTPTGNLPCMKVDAGTADLAEPARMHCLEIVSMSGLQVDFYSDYIGGEVRLAYYHDGKTTIPVTGISISGKLSQVLSQMRLSDRITVHNGYCGPDKALLTDLSIF